jgi:putative colanic acid biosynthesis acetyltransferase WcaF
LKNLDIAKNRIQKKYSLKEYCYRILWEFGNFIFRYTPRPCFQLRRMILRFFGAKIGSEVNIYSSVKIFFPWNLEIGNYSSIGENAQIYNLGLIKIGEYTTISQNSHLCSGTHDYKNNTMPLVKTEIIIANNVWICADAFIGPNVVINDYAIIAARAVVVKNVMENEMVGGNPAQYIKLRS